MANTRAARDTFLHYLSDNLPSLVFHNMRVDKKNPKLNEIMVNAVNVTFHNTDFSGPSDLSQVLVTVDVIYDSELDAVAAAESITRLLFTAAFAPLMDYTIPSAPVQISNERLFWNLALNFKPVHADNFFHMSALLHLSVHFQ
jgi:hypothetical protein